MYTKQESIFWWNLDDYVGKKDFYQKLSVAKKNKIENNFRLAYYGLMQYQLYKGRQLQSIELENIEQISDYIQKNFDNLFESFSSFSKEEEHKTKKYSLKDKQDFFVLLEELLIPYINDHSFETISEMRITKESISTFIMQLAIKNQFDINILDNEGKHPKTPFYSEVYPFMITLLIIDPTTPEKIYENVHNFFTPKMIRERYSNGRVLSVEEIEVLAPLMDLVNNSEDYSYFLFNFSEENWKKHDLLTRFKITYQLSKLTAILLKENIASLTYLENEKDLYDLIESYLPIILRSEEELFAYRRGDQEYYFEKKQHPEVRFLLPWSLKTFDPKVIKSFYQKNKVQDVEFEMSKLYKMMDISLYASSYVRLLNILKKDSHLLEKVFIEHKKIALVNSLKVFKVNSDFGYKQLQDFNLPVNDLFLDQQTLQEIENFKRVSFFKKTPLMKQINSLLKLISYALSLDPDRVKDFDYSLYEFIKYYLILFGPYTSSKIGYNTKDFELLTIKIIEVITTFKSKNQKYLFNEKHLIKLGYYLHIYLIEKLLEFSKNQD